MNVCAGPTRRASRRPASALIASYVPASVLARVTDCVGSAATAASVTGDPSSLLYSAPPGPDRAGLARHRHPPRGQRQLCRPRVGHRRPQARRRRCHRHRQPDRGAPCCCHYHPGVGSRLYHHCCYYYHPDVGSRNCRILGARCQQQRQRH